MEWYFTKSSAYGNDFILFDNRHGAFPLDPKLISRLCHRQKGIGADGVILLESSAQAHFGMRILNADGSEAAMCGNGVLCLADWLEQLGCPLSRYRIKTMQRLLTVVRSGRSSSLEMGPPVDLKWNLSIVQGAQVFEVHQLDTGVPHAVLFADHSPRWDFLALGAFMRHHAQWQPQGINFTAVEVIGPALLAVRTYERGVEGETLACGTGAVAAALAAAYHQGMSSPIKVRTALGEVLQVEFEQHDGRYSRVTLTGTATCTFQGKVDLSRFLR